MVTRVDRIQVDVIVQVVPHVVMALDVETEALNRNTDVRLIPSITVS